MIIKKFQGKTEAQAVESAKKELGSNVVIMNVRNVKNKGILSFLKPQVVEVTVALEDEPVNIIPPKKPEQRPQPPAKDIPVKAPEAPKEDGQERENAQAGKEADPQAENKKLEEKINTLHSLLEQQLQKPEEAKDESEEQEETEVDRFMKLLYYTMLENEVNEQYANQIVDEIKKINKPNMPFNYALANTYQKMILKFGKPMEIEPAEKGPKVIFFVGPTGVGKTTTIAKIASKFSVEGDKKVALLTADTYRIAAAEQLRTYANIMEVPFRVIYSTEEIEQALRDFRDYDFIMVDTAGHSPQNEAQKETMVGFIHSVDGLAEKDVFLVLSATTKYKDLLSIADSYSAMTEYNLIFTKLDETSTLGSLLNVRLHTGAPLSYVTYGQNVPEDIEVFNPQKTVKQLLGGKKK
ncbi:flagellar biosynthesis protein FlhF [Parablautia intestinalis]|jgi:flagellar biosynthesis protein FlhF|uniref:Flagellar biosynthesis protein FlhF n=1 Tax=Parablautia intestinalis TaxID=2320100 RepID=A0A3A9B1L0_9FIRM|nr:flagellar biosynthesis protein FlhF [Parablautia intestinalis]MCI8614279.1 flagellar biosynthesis protein FlhF [Lachnospiraceae bacterium]MDE7047578.1 flagellar biosynthesis protein FlhF [Lachnospiraceae bacterium]RKI93663.1 flagellar biosynthesis protein FlhF [Parablautia intestinalis]